MTDTDPQRPEAQLSGGDVVESASASAWSSAGIDPDRIEQQGFTLSVLGDFNPVIFHPQWFVANGLLTPEDVFPALEPTAETYVTPLMASWAIRPYQVRVSQAVFLMETYAAELEVQLLESLRQVFTLTPHSPVRQLEIERFVHYRTSDSRPGYQGSGPEEVSGEQAPRVSAAMNSLSAYDLWQSLLPGSSAENVTVAAVADDHVARLSVQPSTVQADWLYVTASEGYVAVEPGPAHAQGPTGEDLPTVVSVIDSHGNKAIERTRNRIAETLRAVV